MNEIEKQKLEAAKLAAAAAEAAQQAAAAQPAGQQAAAPPAFNLEQTLTAVVGGIVSLQNTVQALVDNQTKLQAKTDSNLATLTTQLQENAAKQTQQVTDMQAAAKASDDRHEKQMGEANTALIAFIQAAGLVANTSQQDTQRQNANSNFMGQTLKKAEEQKSSGDPYYKQNIHNRMIGARNGR